jgi:hypothetical protein
MAVAPNPGVIPSRIISEFPLIFREFRGKSFWLLWRGNRDGFTAKEFHRRCDGHANTLIVILDTEGNIFGGFTPTVWEFGHQYMADHSLKSFLFTLKNPHNIPERRFALVAEKKDFAISCRCECGPFFGDDVGVFDNCDANTRSYTSLGWTYTNDTGLDGRIVLAGAEYFPVQEIEVFEITE